MTLEWLEKHKRKQQRIRAGRMPSITRRFPYIAKGVCKVCKGKVGNLRWNHYCSSECRDRAYAFYGWGNMRSYVYTRDGGKCTQCGCDLEKLKRILNLVRAFACSLRRELGFRSSGSLFDTDHIVPVIDGGTFEPENLRTLCTPCHKIETAALAAKRAEARRLADTLFAGDK